MNRIETQSTIYTLEGNLLVSTLKSGRKMNIYDVAENAEARKSMNLAYPILFLMDLRALKDMSLEAIIATNNQDDVGLFAAGALVVDQPLHQLIVREAKRFRTFSMPVRSFTDYDKAVDWLKQVDYSTA